jgi:hypothetical protein
VSIVEKGKKLKYKTVLLFVARPTAGKTTLLTSNPQASRCCCAIGVCRGLSYLGGM